MIDLLCKCGAGCLEMGGWLFKLAETGIEKLKGTSHQSESSSLRNLTSVGPAGPTSQTMTGYPTSSGNPVPTTQVDQSSQTVAPGFSSSTLITSVSTPEAAIIPKGAPVTQNLASVAPINEPPHPFSPVYPAAPLPPENINNTNGEKAVTPAKKNEPPLQTWKEAETAQRLAVSTPRALKQVSFPNAPQAPSL